MIRVTLNMSNATNRQGISHCLESRHPGFFLHQSTDCLRDSLQNDLESVEWDFKHYNTYTDVVHHPSWSYLKN